MTRPTILVFVLFLHCDIRLVNGFHLTGRLLKDALHVRYVYVRSIAGYQRRRSNFQRLEANVYCISSATYETLHYDKQRLCHTCQWFSEYIQGGPKTVSHCQESLLNRIENRQ